MDLIDRKIILEMIHNCRITYQALADKFGISANAVNKRIAKLVDLGVITYDVVFSYENVDAEPIWLHVKTDESRTRTDFTEALGSHVSVHVVSPLLNEEYIVLADVRGSSELSDLIMETRRIEGVLSIETHNILTYRGKKTHLSKDQMRVLRHLLEDARMPVRDIAQRSGITARRVSRAINQMIEGEGVHFMARWNPNMGNYSSFFLKMDWNPKRTNLEDVLGWLPRDFSESYWLSYISASEPTIFSIFTVEHIRDAKAIVDRIHADPKILSATTLLSYPSRLWPRPRRVWLEELIDASGY